MVPRSIFIPILLLSVVAVPGAQAQFEGRAPDTLRLDDLSAFESPAGNWSVADSVWADPHRSHHLEATSGTGVLVNQPTEAARRNLRTRWTHGDVKIEMDVLMPRESNSGIYLQGRYEVQLLDSWGEQNPTYEDMGGIYQRWDGRRPEGERGFEGHPPRRNVAKAPGLWQHLTIDFRAPRFNAEGKKVENARFEKVALNGVVIHRNIELRGPTRGAAFQNEAPEGPLLLQGNHGPVAFKNVQYKRYWPGTLALTDLSYKRYDARLDEGLHQLDTVSVAAQGPTDRISQDLTAGDDDVAMVFESTLTVPRPGTYTFELVLPWISGASDPEVKPGGGRLHVDGKLALVHPGSTRMSKGSIELVEGEHSFRFEYFKNQRGAGNVRPKLYVEGPHLRRRPLTSEPLPKGLSDPILITPDAEPYLHRSFLRHGGTKKTHVISVGHPQGVHYAYDLVQGSLLRAWKGRFVMANRMWEGRGHEQLAVPQGTGPVFSGAPPLAVLPRQSVPWPDSVQRSVTHEYLGYRLDEHDRPTFRYRFEGVKVTDRIHADSTGGRLTRQIRVSGRPTSDQIFVRLLQAEALRRADPGRFVVGDRAFYVEVADPTSRHLRVRHSEGGRELLVPVSAGMLPISLRYEIIW